MTEHLAADILVELIDRRLSDSAARDAQEHFASCPSCRLEFEALRDAEIETGGTCLPEDRLESLSYAAVARRTPAEGVLLHAKTQLTGLPDPDLGVFLAGFPEHDLEVFGFDNPDGYWIAVFHPANDRFVGVRAEGLGQEMAFPSGWIGRLNSAGREPITMTVNYAGHALDIKLLPVKEQQR